MICNRFYNTFVITMLIIIMLLFNPKVVSANIMCNDGSRSPSCSDCHQGCCSHHGGCATDNSSYYNNAIEDSKTENYSETESNESYNESEEIEENENSDEIMDYDESDYDESDYDESDYDNSSDSSGIILPLLIGGGIAGAVVLGNKNKSKFIDK